jgi:oxygen-independent coproporphyrinogen-3 oxidase
MALDIHIIIMKLEKSDPAVSSPAESLYTRQVPRYTSYPTALEFKVGEFSPELIRAIKTCEDALSLYIHIPFCESLCYYCGCNKVITQDNSKADTYLDAVAKEVHAVMAQIPTKLVSHLHLGGGSPSFLSIAQHARLLAIVQQYFVFQDDCQLSIELDPRTCDSQYIDSLAELGYRRLSFGVQDTHLDVQKTINRVQCDKHIGTLITHAYAAGFDNINIDLIVGLPEQTRDTVTQTIQDVLQWDVERITVFNYAHLPQRFAAQRKFCETQLPSLDERQAMTGIIRDHLCNASYFRVGMDHYAKAHDPLVIASKSGVLQRNFQGYTADNNQHIVGFGLSAISTVNRIITQNPSKLGDYMRATQQAGLHHRGLLLTDSDIIRKTIINHLMCNNVCDLGLIGEIFDLDAYLYFQKELRQLRAFDEAGVIHLEGLIIVMRAEHIPLVRVIASLFDEYYIPTQGFSNVL